MARPKTGRQDARRFSSHLWGPRGLPVYVNIQADGALSSLVVLTHKPLLQPMFGGDVGITFPLLGGRIGGGLNVDFLDIQHPMIDMGNYVTDIAGQLRYTHPIAGRVRLDVMVEAGVTGGGPHDKGGMFGGLVQVIYKVAPWASIYGSFQEDIRTYKDDTIQHQEFSFVSPMLRFGLALHNLGPFFTNDF